MRRLTASRPFGGSPLGTLAVHQGSHSLVRLEAVRAPSTRPHLPSWQRRSGRSPFCAYQSIGPPLVQERFGCLSLFSRLPLQKRSGEAEYKGRILPSPGGHGEVESKEGPDMSDPMFQFTGVASQIDWGTMLDKIIANARKHEEL